ncbi:response regulator [Sphingomonas sp. MMS24-J13]|uniref:response regulator n=1 Tax=Sphingomonas sp. MMS24-J13 TaxID=3238686 RepID=UPI00384E7646
MRVLTGLAILIAEDQVLLALDLAAAVEEQGGVVIGPVANVAEALVLAETGPIAAAILDANLLDRDVTPLALHLIERGIPLVIHTGTGLPDALARAHPDLAVVMKPVPPELVLEALDREIARKAGGGSFIEAQTIRLDMPGPGDAT